MHKAMHIVALQGNKLIVTNKKPDEVKVSAICADSSEGPSNP
jgi:hypothetical protein